MKFDDKQMDSKIRLDYAYRANKPRHNFVDILGEVITVSIAVSLFVWACWKYW